MCDSEVLDPGVATFGAAEAGAGADAPKTLLVLGVADGHACGGSLDKSARDGPTADGGATGADCELPNPRKGGVRTALAALMALTLVAAGVTAELEEAEAAALLP